MTELTHIEAIRSLSGIFEDDNEKMQLRLFLCCMIARNVVGDATDAFTDQQLVKVGIKLKRFERSGKDEELAKTYAENEYPEDMEGDRGIAYLSYLAGLLKGYELERAAWKHFVIQEKDELQGKVLKLTETLKWVRADIAFDRKEDVIVRKIDEVLGSP